MIIQMFEKLGIIKKWKRKATQKWKSLWKQRKYSVKTQKAANSKLRQVSNMKQKWGLLKENRKMSSIKTSSKQKDLWNDSIELLSLFTVKIYLILSKIRH